MAGKHKLETLFDNVLIKSYELRKANHKFDGQKFWQPIKKILEPIDIYHAKEWKVISKSKTKKIMLLPEFNIDGYGNKSINEKNHFIIQQVRIPITEQPTIKKIIQIALNIGQYNGVNNNKFIYNLKLTDINQFINKSDIVELSKYIPDDILHQINQYLASV